MVSDCRPSDPREKCACPPLALQDDADSGQRTWRFAAA